MATDFLVKQGRVMGGVRLVTDADVAHQTDLTNIRETGTTASQAISAGTYFYLNGTLVRAKADIANGATFTLNTNYEVVTAGALNEINNKFNYSETEHIVGKWVDGSTLYEKTVNIGTMPNATYKNTNHGVSNMGSVVSVIGTMIRTTDNICKPLPFGLTSSSNFVSVEVTPFVVYVTTGTDYSTYKGYITIRYTKTS